MPLEEIARLGPMEAAPDRPFTSPAHSQADFAVLDQMRARLLDTVRGMRVDPPPGTVLHIAEEDGRTHRIVPLNRAGLLTHATLSVVGFFGQRRPDADPSSMAGLDDELIDELRSHPLILSYSSRELPCGGWGNLVVLASPQAAQSWRESARHAYAASRIAPSYYATIRIHNGLLPAGLASPALVHTRTMYYDFQGSGCWKAIRTLDETPQIRVI